MAVKTPSDPVIDRDDDIEAGVIEDARARQRRHRVFGAAGIAAATVAAGLIIGFAGGGGGSGSGGGGHDLGPGRGGAPQAHQALSAPKPAVLARALRRCDNRRPVWNGAVRPFAHGLAVSAVNGRYVALVSSVQGDVCVTAIPPSDYLPDGGGQGGRIPAPLAGKLSDEGGGGSFGGLGGAVWFDYGRAGRGVRSVEFVFPKHRVLAAVVHDGWYLALLPDGSDRDLEPVSVRVVTSDGTVVSPVPGARCNSDPHACVFMTQPAPAHRPPALVGRPVPNGPGLKRLLANLAILRRPQSAADRSWTAPCDCGSTVQVRSLTRLATTLPGGDRVFLDVKQTIVGGGQTHSPGSYILSLDIVDPNGNTTSESVNPSGRGTSAPLSTRSFAGGGPLHPGSSPQAFATVVPDGVATVKWTFVVSCPKVATSLDTRCPKAGTQTVTVPVTNNVAARMLPAVDGDPFYTSVTRIVWLSRTGRVIRSS